MEKTIVIADDNLNYCNNLNYFFSHASPKIKIVGIAHTGLKTLELLNACNPNFLILDLNMPDKNGLEILNIIEENDNLDTKVIITSGEVPMLNRLNFIRSKKLLNIFVKPFDNSILYSAIQSATSNDLENIDVIIDSFLHKFTFNFTSQSYNYLFLVIKNLLYRPFVLNNAYKQIAIEQNVTPDNIKWGIEKLLSSMIRYTPKKVLLEYIPYTSSPSPKIFIFEIIKLTRKKLDSN